MLKLSFLKLFIYSSSFQHLSHEITTESPLTSKEYRQVKLDKVDA